MSPRILTALALCAFAATAGAQSPPPPKHGCEKPEYLGRLASDNQKRVFQRRLDTYKECIRKFTEEQNAIAKASIDAANAAIAEYNQFVAEINAQEKR